MWFKECIENRNSSILSMIDNSLHRIRSLTSMFLLWPLELLILAYIFLYLAYHLLSFGFVDLSILERLIPFYCSLRFSSL